MRVLVIGKRVIETKSKDNINNIPRYYYDKIFDTLRNLKWKESNGEFVLIHSDDGATDSVAVSWANAHYVKCEIFDIPKWCFKGFRTVESSEIIKINHTQLRQLRNQAIIDIGKPDLAVIFSKGDDTVDIIERVRKAQIPIMEACEDEQAREGQPNRKRRRRTKKESKST